MAACGAAPRSPPGWRGTSAWRRCTRSAAGRRCGGSAGRPRRRGRGMHGRRVPTNKPPSRGARGGGGAGQGGASRPAGEVWAADEHRLGLKPIRRRVWAPIGQRPIALGHHRYEWPQVVAFVQPTSGETVWYLCSGLSKPFFAELLAAFARQTGAGRKRHVILVLDNAGWHGPEGLHVPDGISLVFLPPYSPELQPAEHLWPLVDEPIANRHFASLADLEAVVAERCRRLGAETIRPHTDFHWWPKPISPN